MPRDEPSDPTEPNYEEWQIDSAHDREFLGRIDAQTPLFYAPEAGQIFRGDVDEANSELVPHDEASWELNPGESLGDLVDRIEGEVGFESLSEFAEEHLESDT